MSVNCFSSINPVLCSTSTGSKSRMQNGSSLRLHHDSAYVRCIGKIPVCISTGSCHRKLYNFVKDVLVTKVAKTDDPAVSSFGEEDITYDFDWGDDADEGTPWEGAIIYRRNASISHVEYCTTLERLGLDKLSSKVSISKASIMGLRVTKDVKDYVDGTPVLVSVDITRKKHRIRIDGIIRSVITLSCYRCGEPAAESVYSNFSLLLTEEPVDEPDTIDLGTMYGEVKSRTTVGSAENEDDEEDALIDIEDRLHFPPEVKEIDISKHIRDLIHLEININSICDAKCKGICLRCGTNLNTSSCSCNQNGIVETGFGPLGDLKKQMQAK